MSLRPGRNLFLCALGGVGVVALSFLYDPVLLALTPLALIATGLFVADFVALRKMPAGVKLKRQMPQAAGRGAHFDVALNFSNEGSHKLSGAHRDLLPLEAEPNYAIHGIEIPAGGATRVTQRLQIPVRGNYKFGPVWLRATGRFGMLEQQWSVDCPGEIKVLPATALSDDSLERAERSELKALEKKSRARLRGDGLEFESLSEFRDGDDPRRIDWRTTARMAHPVVRRFQVEQHRDMVIVLDCGRLMGIAADYGDQKGTKLDRAVDAALMLSHVALEKGDRCGLALFDDKVIGFMPPQAGGAAHKAILDNLYNVQSRLREANFAAMFATLQSRQQKRSLVVILSDLVDAETSEQFRGALVALAKRHVVIFAALRTPLLSALLREPVDSTMDITRKGVALRLLRAREKALHSLDHTGVHVLDVEPRQLTVPLVNKYVALRERNAL